jgi:hypothetical protein
LVALSIGHHKRYKIGSNQQTRRCNFCVALVRPPMNHDQRSDSMFHPQSYLSTTELVNRVLRESFGDNQSALCNDLIKFSFELFHGNTPLFQACDTAFHDFEHTMQATAAVADLLEAHKHIAVIASLAQRDWEITIAAIIFHDTGYLKRRGDLDGSGAKYSSIHVGRSCFHAWDLLPGFGFTNEELRKIQNAICATGLSVRMEQIPFRDPQEWLMGAIVATGDMLGQMAAEDYPERLGALYLEFREAIAFSRLQTAGLGMHRSLLDLLNGTERFYHGYVTQMLEQEWKGIYRMLDDCHGNNRYIERIRINLARIKLMARSLATAWVAHKS